MSSSPTAPSEKVDQQHLEKAHVEQFETRRYPPDFEAEVAKNHIPLRGRLLTAGLAFIAGTGFTLFGYDQGVMSSLLTGNQFEAQFPQVVVESSHPNHATLQSFIIAIYEVGCLAGALTNLVIGDPLGRRRTIALGGVIMAIGAILQTTSFSFAQLIVARIVTGFGNGMITSTVPTYHAECSPAASRGQLIMLEGCMIVFGVTWIDFGCYFMTNSSAQWRLPLALQLVFELIMICFIWFLPESPRWLVKHGRDAEAMAVISALEDKPFSDGEVQRTFHAIREAVAMEFPGLSDKKQSSFDVLKTQMKELLTNDRSQNFRRASIGIVCQMMQQLTGINLVTYYATILFQRLGLSDINSRIIASANGTEYFLASWIAYYFVERVHRRTLMLVGTIGQCITMALLAIMGAIDNGPANVFSAVLLFAFNTFFAIGWLGMGWLYPAELSGLRTRTAANALSTASNWTWNFVVVMVVGPSFNNINWGTYIVFAVLNALIVPGVYFFFPETGGRSLEDMDVVFAYAHIHNLDPVKVSLRKDIPPAGTPEADEILGVHPGLRRRASQGTSEDTDSSSEPKST
ncbi:general substrate transporter [Coniophora puteana RWD-64-598 SS2]|uniref:General substrate transporter n=1 Tax=Coniophora puteana (strain RWD-64-598) TaxID=741705 RepID=A0A5M3MRG6_CONPW|nr:general substrate transporter [Coniophora puteana RWD-64-598 SS2]EIW81743.1 general substrate transporter [Coniophora puteana RWD-64-598 SS2]